MCRIIVADLNKIIIIVYYMFGLKRITKEMGSMFSMAFVTSFTPNNICFLIFKISSSFSGLGVHIWKLNKINGAYYELVCWEPDKLLKDIDCTLFSVFVDQVQKVLSAGKNNYLQRGSSSPNSRQHLQRTYTTILGRHH
ncbi:uncharacterized protein TA20155 [Theileria annulata]|uniref:Uncharacterized protein n=1 Tax=Theileria annulata TaxID=5874 RepID=Q4UHC6_THEAN|nr:uncharacterized protein TA20155 [Theileria annulata]CAI73513.1 hypothetical protein TA20155 [Theileria annulata]|eukprot:XP_954190.1 hypothetical protein TA20155 [Theileria annulata]